MRHCLLLVLPLAAACGGKTTAPPPPNNEVAASDTGDTGGDSYGGWEYGGYGGDYYGGYGYGGYGYGGYDQPYVPPPPQPPNLVGTWKSGCVAHEKAFRQHEHVYTNTRWDVRIGEFSDAACTKRTSEHHDGGTYAFGVESTAVPTAWDVTFTTDLREITADDKKSAKAIAKACGVKLKAKGTADVLAKGCPKLGIRPQAECASAHDVAALQGDKIRLGNRAAPADVCVAEKRPTALDTSVDVAYVWTSVGIKECDDLIGQYPVYVKCPGMPPGIGDQMFDGFRQMHAAFLQNASPTSDPAAVKAAADACKQGLEAMKQGMTAMGC